MELVEVAGCQWMTNVDFVGTGVGKVIPECVETYWLTDFARLV